MIVTLTLNPALDITTSTPTVRSSDKLRCGLSRYDPGGGGINVARVAHELGESVRAVFPAGGLTGGQIVGLLAQAGIPMSVINIEGPTRESFTVNETTTGEQYRFVLPGPTLGESVQRQLLDRLDEVVPSASYVAASGSLPPGIRPGFLDDVARVCAKHGKRFVVDSSGAGLSELTAKVFLLKPSVRELRDLTGRPLATIEEQVAAAREIVDRGGADVVVVSKAAAGVLLVTATDDILLPAVPVPPGSGVGAGDALVAGIVVGLERGWELIDAVRYGMSAGAAMLLTPGTQVCSRADVERLYAALLAQTVANA